MKFTVIFRAEAEKDLEDIDHYYSEIAATLSARFFQEFFETLNYIETEPKLFQERYRSIRIAPLYRFPYGIHYKVKGTSIIIYRVLHTKRYFKQ